MLDTPAPMKIRGLGQVNAYRMVQGRGAVMATGFQNGIVTIPFNTVDSSAFEAMLFPTGQRTMTEITNNYRFYGRVAKGNMAGNQQQPGQQNSLRSGTEGYEDAPWFPSGVDVNTGNAVTLSLFSSGASVILAWPSFSTSSIRITACMGI